MIKLRHAPFLAVLVAGWSVCSWVVPAHAVAIYDASLSTTLTVTSIDLGGNAPTDIGFEYPSPGTIDNELTQGTATALADQTLPTLPDPGAIVGFAFDQSVAVSGDASPPPFSSSLTDAQSGFQIAITNRGMDAVTLSLALHGDYAMDLSVTDAVSEFSTAQLRLNLSYDGGPEGTPDLPGVDLVPLDLDFDTTSDGSPISVVNGLDLLFDITIQGTGVPSSPEGFVGNVFLTLTAGGFASVDTPPQPAPEPTTLALLGLGLAGLGYPRRKRSARTDR